MQRGHADRAQRIQRVGNERPSADRDERFRQRLARGPQPRARSSHENDGLSQGIHLLPRKLTRRRDSIRKAPIFASKTLKVGRAAVVTGSAAPKRASGGVVNAKIRFLRQYQIFRCYLVDAVQMKVVVIDGAEKYSCTTD